MLLQKYPSPANPRTSTIFVCIWSKFWKFDYIQLAYVQQSPAKRTSTISGGSVFLFIYIYIYIYIYRFWPFHVPCIYYTWSTQWLISRRSCVILSVFNFQYHTTMPPCIIFMHSIVISSYLTQDLWKGWMLQSNFFPTVFTWPTFHVPYSCIVETWWGISIRGVGT